MSLIVQLRDLWEQPVVLTIDHSPQFFDLKDEDFEFTDRIQGEVVFTLVQKNVLAQGWLKTRAYGRCVRCLERIAVDINARVELVYSNDPKLKEDVLEFDPLEEIIYYFDNEIIEPKEQFRELIMLELPFLPICSESCKGLCPVCGRNRNTEPCLCKIDEAMTEKSTGWKQALKRINLKK